MNLHLRQTNSSPKSCADSACPRPTRKAKRLANRRLLLRRMTRFFKRCSTGTTRTLPLFVRLALKSSPPRSVRGRSGFWTSPSVADCLYRSHTTARSQAGGQRQRAAPSTCRTSSEDRSCAKLLWLPKGTNWSSAICHRLNREFLRGWLITRTCYSSSGKAVILTQRSALRCSTYRALQKSHTLISGSRRSPRFWAVVTDWAGLHSPPSYSWVSSVRRLNAMTKTSQRSSALPRRTYKSFLSGTTTSRR